MSIKKHREQKKLITSNQYKKHSLIAIIQIEQSPSGFRFFVMFTFQKSDIHLIPMRNQIQCDIPQKYPCVLRQQGRENCEHYSIGGTIADHVQDCSEASRLVEISGCHAVECVEELTEAVESEGEERVGVVDGQDCEEEGETEVADYIRDEEEDHRFFGFINIQIRDWKNQYFQIFTKPQYSVQTQHPYNIPSKFQPFKIMGIAQQSNSMNAFRYNIQMMQSAPIKDEILKSYIQQIFSRYDSNSSGTLNPTQMTNFFNDLFQSLNIPLVLTAQQSLETIKAVNPSYNGTVSRDELFSTFKVLLGYESMPVQQQTIQQPTNMTPNYGGYQMMNNGGYMTMPNYVNVGNGFVPGQSYMMNPNMMRQGQQQYPNGFVQGYAAGYPNMNNMNGQQFANYRRQ